MNDHDDGVEVGEFTKPNLLVSIMFVTHKNFVLKLRQLVGTLVEVIIPTFFMVALIPAYIAAGSSDYDNREFYGNHFDIDAFYKPWMCRNASIDARLMEYPLCNTSAPATHCLGDLCLNSSVPLNDDDGTLSRMLDPFYFVENSTTIPSYDTIALLRHFSMYADIPGTNNFGVNVANALRTGDGVAFVPQNPDVAHVVADYNEWFNSKTYTYNFTKRSFSSERDATNYATSRDGSSKIWALVVFRSRTDFVIRMNRTATPSTDDYDSESMGLNKQFRQYIGGGFLSIQTLLNAYITNGTDDQTATIMPMPIQGYSRNGFLDAAGDFLPIILTLAFLFPMSQIVSNIVKEKEARIREAMLIMGLSSWSFKLSWVLTTMLQMSFTGLLLSIVVKASYLHETDYGIIFMLFWSYCLSLASAGILLSVFFSKASLASIVSPMVFLFSAIPSFVLQSSSTGTKSMLSFFNTFAFSEAVSLVYKAAGKGAPMTWSNAGDGSFSFSTALAFLWIDTILYLLLAAWLDQVLPSEWGAKKPFCYYCWPPYWFKKNSSYEELDAVDGMMDRKNLESITDQSLLNMERIKITNLRKEFKSDGLTKVAVNNVNLTLYEGQILALLGHNGAGKTTLINMLTGMLPVTSGDAAVYGNSVCHEMEAVRRDIGLCPQHNILWDNITCAEHLRFYGRVKGIPSDELEDQVDDILHKVELFDKKETNSAALSGGMKRKLSVGISLIGGSRFIILDEPTAGMDVQARRAIWDLLKSVRDGRTILLTTHFMDEADLLGDSIAILHDGRVHCHGSSFFLKQKLGVGYNLTMELGPSGDVDAITNTIKSEIEPLNEARNMQQVELLSAAGSELAFRVPMWGLPNFSRMFEQLEQKGSELGINSFGMSVTTLEEIFIKIAHDNEHHSKEHAVLQPPKNGHPQPLCHSPDGYKEHASILRTLDISPEEKMHGSELMSSQWRGLFFKRFQYSKRDKCTICFQLILPVVVVAYTLGLLRLNVTNLDAISLDKYGKDSIFPVAPATSPYGAIPPLEGVTPMPEAFNTAVNMSNWLLHRTDTKDTKCWQALFQETSNLEAAKTLFFNASNTHSIAVAFNSLANSVYKQKNGNNTYVSMVNDPLPFSDFFKEQLKSFMAVNIATNIMLPFCFIPANYVAFMVKERVTKSKHVQVVSGVRLPVYWMSNFCWDLLAFMVSTFLCFLMFFIFNRKEYVGGGETFLATFLLFFFYGVTAIWAAYLSSFYFESPTVGQNTVLLGNYFSGFALVMTVGILQMVKSTRKVAKVLRFVFRVIPSFCLGDGILALAQLPSNKKMGITSDGALAMDVVGWDIVFLCIMCPVYALLSLSHDFPQIWYALGVRKPPPSLDTVRDGGGGGSSSRKEEEDDDVAAERQAVLGGRGGDVVRVKGLRKVYPGTEGRRPKVAVKEVTFGVKTGEIFAFLGTNGAGKTSTISVLAGDYAPTAGTASIKGHDVVTDAAEAKRELGYCPQFDALLDMLTPREHIELYASLRGVPTSIRGEMANSLIQVLGLQEHENTVCKKLSGGNKRKTSIAISLIGGPSCILLDEPTAGMDPVARRGMWSALQAIGKGRCVVLTTHHLEEVEALAHRTAIMVDGGLQCLGTLSHLKNKFGGAYEVQVKVAPEGEEAFQDFFKTTFPSSDLVEQTNHRLTYQLPAGQRLSEMFSIIQSSRDKLGIVDYSISETSLEQVFIAICKKYVSES
eukprot:TRINITY_DN24_c0_g1_i7.p1 TRINITY_DN24_c0_g1~~TRINITY_DN24_c0_g1_i7.p1  ORF type:complete len:1712 (+),score=594.56 TRINITY_DN24_c0_g1_i7:118-5253(+)